MTMMMLVMQVMLDDDGDDAGHASDVGLLKCC